MLAALDTAMAAAKPSFANDKMYRKEMGDYAVVSCYNTLPIGGCGLTLVRLNMNRLPELAKSPEDLLDRVIPDAVTASATPSTAAAVLSWTSAIIMKITFSTGKA